MGRSVNRVTLVGNVGSDPEVRSTQKGTRVAHVSLATNREWTADGVEQRRTDWHRLTFWGGPVETVRTYVRKGTRMYVEGRLEYGSYERDGVMIPTTDVVVREFVLLDGRGGDRVSVHDRGEVDGSGIAAGQEPDGEAAREEAIL